MAVNKNTDQHLNDAWFYHPLTLRVVDDQMIVVYLVYTSMYI